MEWKFTELHRSSFSSIHCIIIISFLSVSLYHYHYVLFLFNSNYTCHLWVIVKCRLSFPLFNKGNDIAAYEWITTNQSKVILACKAGVILAGECLVFSLQKLWPPSLILWQRKAGEGRRSKIRRGVGELRLLLALLPPPTLTVHSNSKSNMAGWMDDPELITFDRPSETPAQQAEVIQMCQYFLTSISINYWYLAIRFPDCVIEYGSFNEKNRMELGPSASCLFSFH